MTRKLSLILAAFLAANALAACGDSAPDVSDTTAAPESDSATETELTDGVPTVDYGGREFNIIHMNYCQGFEATEEETGDILNDAIFNRYRAVEERFNVQINTIAKSNAEAPGLVYNSVAAGETDTYHLLACHVVGLGPSVLTDAYLNWHDIPHVDFTKPWWSRSTVNDMTYAGKCYIAMGDLSMSTLYWTYCLYFNKDLAESYKLPDLYAMVKDGTWTIDRLLEYSANVYQDVNGNSKADEGDIFGISIMKQSPANAFYWSFGEKGMRFEDNNAEEFSYSYYSEKSVAIFEKMHKLLWESKGTYYPKASDENHLYLANQFMNGESLFIPRTYQLALESLRDMEADYGIIPLPKWDEAQEIYYAGIDGACEGLSVPKCISDPDFTGAIIEALSFESWKNVTPALYDVALKSKGMRDDASAEMLDLIFENRIIDFAYTFGGWSNNNPSMWIGLVMENDTKDIASHYARSHTAFETNMDKVLAFFRGEDA